jgi:uncharacterized membrane protein
VPIQSQWLAEQPAVSEEWPATRSTASYDGYALLIFTVIIIITITIIIPSGIFALLCLALSLLCLPFSLVSLALLFVGLRPLIKIRIKKNDGINVVGEPS